MNKQDIYTDYFINQYSNNTDEKKYYLDVYRYTQKSIGYLFKKDNKEVNILDLGCGFGGFANFCKSKGFTNYTGVDLSNDELIIAKKNFPNYKFIFSDIFDFLDGNNEKYDIIYMSMVFEHLNLTECESIIKKIYSKLNKNGVFINNQPNADSYFNSISSLYIDITHERLWNKDSYLQLIKVLKLKNYEIYFKNSYIGGGVFGNIIHRIIKKIFEFFLLSMGYDYKQIYTKSFYSIIKKL